MAKKKRTSSRASRSRAKRSAANIAPRPLRPDEIAGWTSDIKDAYKAGRWTAMIDAWQRIPSPAQTEIVQGEPTVAKQVAEAYARHGQALNDRGNPVAAIQHLSQSVQLAPANTGFQYELGLMYQRAMEWDTAKEIYSAILHTDPQHERAAYHLCLACLQSGEDLGDKGMFHTVFQQIQTVFTDRQEQLPWPWRRLAAWRDMALTGSPALLESIHAEKPYKNMETALSSADVNLLSLEQGLSIALSGRIEAGRRRIPEPETLNNDPELQALIYGIKAILSARVGHVNKASELAQFASQSYFGHRAADRAQDSQVPKFAGDVIESVLKRAYWEVGLALWWKNRRDESLDFWDHAPTTDVTSAAQVHNAALGLNAVDHLHAAEAWQDLLRLWERDWRERGSWIQPEHGMAYGFVALRVTGEMLERDDINGARRLLRRAERLLPNDPGIILALAMLDAREGKPHAVKDRVPQLAEHFAADIPNLKRVAGMLMYLKLEDEAELVWKQILRHDPDEEEALCALAFVYENRGEVAWNDAELNEAFALFTQAIDHDAEKGSLYVWLGGLHILRGEHALAKQSFLRADSLPDRVDHTLYAWVEVGKHLLAAGYTKEGWNCLNKALDEDDSPHVLIGVGSVLVEAELTEDAMEFLHRACFESGYDEEVVMSCADLLMEARLYEVAIELLDDAIAENPDSILIWSSRLAAEFLLVGPATDPKLLLRVKEMARQAGSKDVVSWVNELQEQVRMERTAHFPW